MDDDTRKKAKDMLTRMVSFIFIAIHYQLQYLYVIALPGVFRGGQLQNRQCDMITTSIHPLSNLVYIYITSKRGLS